MKDYVFWNLKTGPGSVQEIGTILSMNNFHGFTELKVIRLEQERWHVVCCLLLFWIPTTILSNLL
jgi:hypothetical protein